jgi:hypothetical protein
MALGGYSMLKAPLNGSESRNQYPPLTKMFKRAIGGLIISDVNLKGCNASPGL